MAKKILIVEDERALASAVQEKMKSAGFEVETASSSARAVEVLEGGSVDAIWLDHYLLGEETGLDFVATLKEKEEWKEIPVFVVSNTATADKVKTYMQLGVEKYYVKSDTRLEDVIKDIQQAR